MVFACDVSLPRNISLMKHIPIDAAANVQKTHSDHHQDSFETHDAAKSP